MKIIRNIGKAQRCIKLQKEKGRIIGFVPTMGALHEGHISLIRQARKDTDFVVVSVFVNPIQFGPREDFKRYPRNIMRDAFICRNEEADIIFYPSFKEMYPPGFKTYVGVQDLSALLCGKSRTGHFSGVTTVVSKLFNILQPDIAYFGQKDAQQAIIIKKMVEDLDVPVKIKIMPTIREDSGLAMSSRNYYLDIKRREEAAVLYKALSKAKKMIRQGRRSAKNIIAEMRRIINAKRTVKIDYISIVDTDNLGPVKFIKGKVLIALAAWIGKTRLIDNIVVDIR